MQQIEKFTNDRIIQRLEILENARGILKKEFVGIDAVIDDLIQSVRTWYTLPSVLERPVVVNLWGMTGTGKTSLIKRFVEFIEFETSFYPLDMGNLNDYRGNFFSTLEELYEHNSGSPFILLFDEFQHARSLKDKEDHSVGRMGDIWKMLDTGQLNVHDFDSALITIKERIRILKFCLKKGVKVENGVVVGKLGLFSRITGDSPEDEQAYGLKHYKRLRKGKARKKLIKTTPKLPFFPSYELDDLMDLIPGQFQAQFEVEEFLLTLDGQATIEFLESSLKEGKKPKAVDCSRSLIFVAGNLDDAYPMSGDLDPDIPANVWKNMASKISLNHIKSALTKRFRSEHIARLGNNHIIYPAMGEREFVQFIQNQVGGICQDFEKRCGVRLIVSNRIKNVIYEEGVYPTQGFRPINSTINHILQCNLPNILASALIDHSTSDEIRLTVRRGKMTADFYSGQRVIGSMAQDLKLNLAMKRKPKHDDQQAVTSVHEAGHVVCSVLLLSEIPEIALSTTSAIDSNGYVIRDNKDVPMTKEHLIRTIALMLGGFVAEKLVFGDENITTGSQSDIAKSSAIVKQVLSSSGFELGPAFYENGNADGTFVQDVKGETDRLAIKYLNEAEEMAVKVLTKERILLLRVAEKLFAKGSLSKAEMKRLTIEYTSKGSLPQSPEFPFKKRFLDTLKQVDPLQKVA